MSLFTRLLVIMLALATCAGAAAKEAQGGRIVAVGDLHGDFAAFTDIVQTAGLADGNGRWTGGKATLVQLGDVPDRGPDSLRIVRALMRLEKEAAKAGGRVIALVGNHEAMNATGDLRYVVPGEFAAFADKDSARRREAAWEANRIALEEFYAARPDPAGRGAKERWFAETPLGKLEHQRAWSANGEVGRWIASHPAIALIDGTLFVHGGLSVETVARARETVNREVRDALRAGGGPILTDPLGPLWYRGNVDPKPAESRPPPAGEIAAVLAAYGAGRLVVAHTPQVTGIATFDEGRVICVDTGISAAYGGRRSFLELTGANAVAHERGADGTWGARRLPMPGRDDR